MKYKIIIMLLFFSNKIIGQECQLFNALNIVSSVGGTPDHMFKVGYDISPSNNLSYYAEIANEGLAVNKKNYSSYSLSLGARYYVLGGNNQQARQRVNILTGLIGIIQYEDEATLYEGKSFKKHLNYGAGLHILTEIYCSERVGIVGGFEQRIFINSPLAVPNMNLFLGLRIHFLNKYM